MAVRASSRPRRRHRQADVRRPKERPATVCTDRTDCRVPQPVRRREWLISPGRCRLGRPRRGHRERHRGYTAQFSRRLAPASSTTTRRCLGSASISENASRYASDNGSVGLSRYCPSESSAYMRTMSGRSSEVASRKVRSPTAWTVAPVGDRNDCRLARASVQQIRESRAARRSRSRSEVAHRDHQHTALRPARQTTPDRCRAGGDDGIWIVHEDPPPMNLNRTRSASLPGLIIKTVGALPVLRDLCW